MIDLFFFYQINKNEKFKRITLGADNDELKPYMCCWCVYWDSSSERYVIDSIRNLKFIPCVSVVPLPGLEALCS